MPTATRSHLCALRPCAPAHAGSASPASKKALTRALCPDARVLVIGGVFPGQGRPLSDTNSRRSSGSPGNSMSWKPPRTLLQMFASSPFILRSIRHEPPGGRSRISRPLLARFHRGSPLRLEGVMTHLFAADEADGESQTINLQLDGVRSEPASRPRAFTRGAQRRQFRRAARRPGRTGSPTLPARHGMKALLRPGLALYGLVPTMIRPFDRSRADLARPGAPRICSPCSAGKLRSSACAPSARAQSSATTEPSLPPSPCAWRSSPRLWRRPRSQARQSLQPAGARPARAPRRPRQHGSVCSRRDRNSRCCAGDEVVILGTQGGETITAFDHAEATGTIPWEVFTRIGARVPRIAV